MSTTSSHTFPADQARLLRRPHPHPHSLSTAERLTTQHSSAASANGVAKNGLTVPSWARWFGWRLLSGIAVVLMITVIVFGATQALPSDPARVILGPDAPESSVRLLQQQLGLDQPVTAQYLNWLGKAVQGDLGRSLDSHVPVTGLLLSYTGNSLALLSGVLALTIPLALSLGVFLALRRDTSLDRFVVSSLISLKAIPTFALGIALVMFFSTSVLSVLPAVSLLDPNRSPWGQFQYLILPASTLVLSSLPYLVRLVRTSMIEALDSEYVTAARMRGIPESRIVWRHAMPNALIPAIQGISLMLSVLLGGTLVVEVVFTYPGLGSALNTAIELRDLPVIQAIVFLIAGAVVLVNLAADLLTVLLTPRLRTAAGSGTSAKFKGAWRRRWMTSRNAQRGKNA